MSLCQEDSDHPCDGPLVCPCGAQIPIATPEWLVTQHRSLCTVYRREHGVPAFVPQVHEEDDGAAVRCVCGVVGPSREHLHACEAHRRHCAATASVDALAAASGAIACPCGAFLAAETPTWLVQQHRSLCNVYKREQAAVAVHDDAVDTVDVADAGAEEVRVEVCACGAHFPSGTPDWTLTLHRSTCKVYAREQQRGKQDVACDDDGNDDSASDTLTCPCGVLLPVEAPQWAIQKHRSACTVYQRETRGPCSSSSSLSSLSAATSTAAAPMMRRDECVPGVVMSCVDCNAVYTTVADVLRHRTVCKAAATACSSAPSCSVPPPPAPAPPSTCGGGAGDGMPAWLQRLRRQRRSAVGRVADASFLDGPSDAKRRARVCPSYRGARAAGPASERRIASFTTGLNELRRMGFSDPKANGEALYVCGCDVEAAAAFLSRSYNQCVAPRALPRAHTSWSTFDRGCRRGGGGASSGADAAAPAWLQRLRRRRQGPSSAGRVADASFKDGPLGAKRCVRACARTAQSQPPGRAIAALASGLNQLRRMGFTNAEANGAALHAHGGDVQAAACFLLRSGSTVETHHVDADDDAVTVGQDDGDCEQLSTPITGGMSGSGASDACCCVEQMSMCATTGCVNETPCCDDDITALVKGKHDVLDDPIDDDDDEDVEEGDDDDDDDHDDHDHIDEVEEEDGDSGCKVVACAESLAQLQQMGFFDSVANEKALQSCDNDVEKAVLMLLRDMRSPLALPVPEQQQ